MSVYTPEVEETTVGNYDYYEETEVTTKSMGFRDEFSKPERTPKVIRNEGHEGQKISSSILDRNVETKNEAVRPTADEGLLKGEKSSLSP